MSSPPLSEAPPLLPLSEATPLDPVTLVAAAVDDQRRRRPLRVEARTQPLELVGILAHMRAHGRELLLDEVHDSRIRIHLGIQPSTAASHRGGAEVEQHRFAAAPFQRCFEIAFPGDLFIYGGHGSSRRNSHALC